MKLIRTTAIAVSAAALSIGAAFAGEDSTHRYHGTGPEWHEPAELAAFNDADSRPDTFADPVVVGNEPVPAHESVAVVEVDRMRVIEPAGVYELEQNDWPRRDYNYNEPG